MRGRQGVNKLFLGITLLLLLGGLLIFMSASLGLLARPDTDSASGFATRQILEQIVAAFAGLFLMGWLSKFPYKKLKRWSLLIFFTTFALTALVFVPGIGEESGGGRRWIDAGPVSVQPVEFLKLGFVIYFAALLSSRKDRLGAFGEGIFPAIAIFAVIAGLLLAQPNTSMTLIIIGTGVIMLFAAEVKLKYLMLLGLLGIVVFGGVLFARPYTLERVRTFIDPESADPRGEGWQINQALIAVGSGGITGKGFGHSTQKFGTLPEPTGDSIYAVAAEEFGLFGSAGLIVGFLVFAIAGLRIAGGAPDLFGRLLATGIVILIVLQSYWNIASMMGLMPIAGLPLIFVSNGGTALFLALAEIGIVLNISRHAHLTHHIS